MTRQLRHQYPTLASSVVVGQPAITTGNMSVISYRIENKMREAIYWRNALGFTVTEPPMYSTSEKERVLITITYEFHKASKIDARELLGELDLSGNHAESKQIYDALTTIERHSARDHHRRHFSYTVAVSYQQVVDAGGVVYLNDVDLVIGLSSSQHSRPPHPYSPNGQRERLADTADLKHATVEYYTLVDNAKRYGTLWYNSGQSVLEIQPQRDPSMQDGVYVVSRNRHSGHYQTVHYTFEDALANQGFYLNQVEAETHGSPDDRHKESLKLLEHSIQQQKAENIKLKQYLTEEQERIQRDKEAREREHLRDRDEIERERNNLKMEQERMHFSRDMRQMDRKDQSDSFKSAMEIAKATLSLIGIALSIYALLQKNQKT